jgi:PAS domain S-box-containing protein
MNQMMSRDALALLDEDEKSRSVVITDPSLHDNPIVFVSEEFETQTGYSMADALGRNCRFLQGPETDPVDAQILREAINQEREITVDILNYRKDGSKFWNRLRVRPLFDDRGRVLYFIGAQNPIPIHEVRRFPLNGIRD